ncbi:MAG: siderophore-interacting protein [Pseudomonadota bacterium]
MKAHADITGLSYVAMQGVMLHEAKEHDLAVLKQAPDLLKIKSDYGAFGIQDRGALGLRLEVEADTLGNLHVLRESLVAHIVHYLPDLADQIAWSDQIDAGQTPPNFQFAEVLASQKISRDFLRLTLKLSKTEGFDNHAIHFRFVLPHPNDPEPKWPVLAANGSTRWPEGDKALHRPVYTVRRQGGDEIDVDIFLHVGGQTTAWAERVQKGARVAMIGPGGGGVVTHKHLVLAGDETAFPAISRILENQAQHTKATVVMLSHTRARDYPLPIDSGTRVIWTDPKGFVASVRDSLDQSPQSFLWLAAGAPIVTTIRQIEMVKALPKTQKHIAAYWAQKGSG